MSSLSSSRVQKKNRHVAQFAADTQPISQTITRADSFAHEPDRYYGLHGACGRNRQPQFPTASARGNHSSDYQPLCGNHGRKSFRIIAPDRRLECMIPAFPVRVGGRRALSMNLMGHAFSMTCPTRSALEMQTVEHLIHQLVRGRAGIKGNGRFTGSRLFQRFKLAVQQARRHVMALP